MRMRQIRRIVPLLIVLGIGFVVLVPANAGAQTTTCTTPSASDFTTPTGAFDVSAYTAAVAASNVCVSNASVTRSVPQSVTEPAPSSTLAFTGSNSTTLVVIAIAVIGLGAGAVLVSRRRRVE
jgi:LPXTG-motif cell wall-anchored protein